MPVEAQFFIDRGIPAATAQSLAQQHNDMVANSSSPSAVPTTRVERMPPLLFYPNPPAPSAPAPLSPMHEAKVAARATELQKLTGTDAATARSVAEQEFAYSRSSGVERSVMLHHLEEGRREEAIVQSIDAGMEPARTPYEYVLPEAETNQNADAHRQLRNVMFETGIPVELGNTIARQVFQTGATLHNATDEQMGAYTGEQEASLRNIWGPAFESKMQTVRSWLHEQGQRSSDLREILEHRPELLSHWTVVEALTRLAESQRRFTSRSA